MANLVPVDQKEKSTACRGKKSKNVRCDPLKESVYINARLQRCPVNRRHFSGIADQTIRAPLVHICFLSMSVKSEPNLLQCLPRPQIQESWRLDKTFGIRTTGRTSCKYLYPPPPPPPSTWNFFPLTKQNTILKNSR